ncbi:MAG: radical SAM protein [Clostridia bacterium]|nr:radical SAM protein [Clostridia bacterium]
MLLNIANIQHFSVGDGPGIRTTVFFKGCNLRCPWCHNPETLSFEKTRLSYPHLDKTEWCGEMKTVEDVLSQVLEDKDFYDESGGGVTLSGGEVMLSADGASVLAKRLCEEGVSVYIDTAGCVPYSRFLKLNDFSDGYLFDFKTPFADKYTSIGGDLETVCSNIKSLIKDNKKIIIRIPLIPGFNTDAESVNMSCKILSELGADEVSLLPFHRTGSGKYQAMGKSYSYKDTKPLDSKITEEIKAEFSKYFNVKVEA